MFCVFVCVSVCYVVVFACLFFCILSFISLAVVVLFPHVYH